MAKLFKRKKTNAKKTMVDGILFDSKLEAQRYKYLKQLEKAGQISKLKIQFPFELIPTQKKGNNKVPSICAERVSTIRKTSYYADFVYLRHKDMKWIINDAKGRSMEVYKLKLKLVILNYCSGQGYTFLETYKDNKRNNFLEF